MTTQRLVRVRDIFAMLAECAQGYQSRRSEHRIHVTLNQKTFQLPKGEHGRTDSEEVETGYVRSMVRHLGIAEECASRMLPNIGFKKKAVQGTQKTV